MRAMPNVPSSWHPALRPVSARHFSFCQSTLSVSLILHRCYSSACGPYFSQYYFIFAPCIVISHVACLSMCTHKYSVRTVSCAREFANTQVTPDLGHPLVDGLLVRRKVFARTIGICVQSLKKRIEWKLEREKVNMKT